MPKDVTGRYLNMVGGYIDPPPNEMLTDIDEDTMAKYEYINLFRKDFR
jgi:hypothetical protein